MPRMRKERCDLSLFFHLRGLQVALERCCDLLGCFRRSRVRRKAIIVPEADGEGVFPVRRRGAVVVGEGEAPGRVTIAGGESEPGLVGRG